MLKVYGTKICPDCIACEASFKKYGIGYEFVNIFATMPDFKEFCACGMPVPPLLTLRSRAAWGFRPASRKTGKFLPTGKAS